MIIKRNYNKPMIVELGDNQYYNVGNISSFAMTNNKATGQNFISITFTRPINGQNGLNIKFKDEYWNSLCDSFDKVKVYC